MIRGSAHKSKTAGCVKYEDDMRGVISDKAKTLGEVIDRVKRSDAKEIKKPKENQDGRLDDYWRGYQDGYNDCLNETSFGL